MTLKDGGAGIQEGEGLSGPFRSSHPGIPRKWTLLGEGGNARVWSDGTHAIKRLKDGASREAVSRFRREAEVLLSLKTVPDLNVVPVLGVREREGSLEIVMARMEGSLEKALNSFAGSPERAAATLKPIASTLAKLAAREEPIFHRDLKPSNLLFSGSEERLCLADFGCAFLAADERLTPAKRAMGSWAYRPPEYSNGRVAEVTEKGDVFSLGKVFWAMINGEPGVVFPGPVWFEPEYDLAKIFPTQPSVHHAMLVISSAAAINPAQRPSMEQLADMFSAFTTPQPQSGAAEVAIKLLRAQSTVEVEFAQRRAATAMFVRALHLDLYKALAELEAIAPDLLLWAEWSREAVRTPQTAEALVEQVATHESDAPIVNSRFRRMFLNTRFHPPADQGPLCFIVRIGSEVDTARTSSFTVSCYADGVRYAQQFADGGSDAGQYKPEFLRDFLIKATTHLL